MLAWKLIDKAGRPPAQLAVYVLEGFPSGQRDQTVNLTALPSEVRILPPPPEITQNILYIKVSALGVWFMAFVESAVTARLSGCSSMVELQSSKLITWVRFPSPAPV